MNGMIVPGAKKGWKSYLQLYKQVICWFVEKTWAWFLIVFHRLWMSEIYFALKSSACQSVLLLSLLIRRTHPNFQFVLHQLTTCQQSGGGGKKTGQQLSNFITTN